MERRLFLEGLAASWVLAPDLSWVRQVPGLEFEAVGEAREGRLSAVVAGLFPLTEGESGFWLRECVGGDRWVVDRVTRGSGLTVVLEGGLVRVAQNDRQFAVGSVVGGEG